MVCSFTAIMITPNQVIKSSFADGYRGMISKNRQNLYARVPGWADSRLEGARPTTPRDADVETG